MAKQIRVSDADIKGILEGAMVDLVLSHRTVTKGALMAGLRAELLRSAPAGSVYECMAAGRAAQAIVEKAAPRFQGFDRVVAAHVGAAIERGLSAL
jgi:hypothetical protein